VLWGDDVDIETSYGFQPAMNRFVGAHIAPVESLDIGKMSAEIINESVVIIHGHHCSTDVTTEEDL